MSDTVYENLNLEGFSEVTNIEAYQTVDERLTKETDIFLSSLSEDQFKLFLKMEELNNYRHAIKEDYIFLKGLKLGLALESIDPINEVNNAYKM